MVLQNQAKYEDKWNHESEQYWLARLIQEVGELSDELVDKKKDGVDHELIQIASISINWLIMRMSRNFEAY